ncbi:MAG: hypothetical protein SGCHY_003701 [Lobulomycetales sp.]
MNVTNTSTDGNLQASLNYGSTTSTYIAILVFLLCLAAVFKLLTSMRDVSFDSGRGAAEMSVTARIINERDNDILSQIARLQGDSILEPLPLYRSKELSEPPSFTTIEENVIPAEPGRSRSGTRTRDLLAGTGERSRQGSANSSSMASNLPNEPPIYHSDNSR